MIWGLFGSERRYATQQESSKGAMATSQETMSDAWQLLHYADAAQRTWREIMPKSQAPPPRAFHASWMIGGKNGFKIVVHGGQSGAGVGEFATMSDTWRFDLTTFIWTPYSADPEAPSVAAAMAIRRVLLIRTSLSYMLMWGEALLLLLLLLLLLFLVVAVCVCVCVCAPASRIRRCAWTGM